MEARRNNKYDLFWGFCAQALQYGSMLLLLPILATRLPSSDVGLWFVFMAMQSLVLLLDLGFGNAFSRNFSYIFAGASQLQKNGVQSGIEGRQVDLHLLRVTIRTARALYAIISMLVFIVLFFAGSTYIYHLGGLSSISGILAWSLFSISIVLNVYFQWYLALLVGSGRVRDSYLALIIVRGGFTVLAALGLFFYSVLWVVSLAYLFAVVSMAFYCSHSVRDIFKQLPVEEMKSKELFDNFSILWHNSYRMGLVSIGAFLITKFSVLLVAYFYGLSVSASYSITLQILSAVSAISLVPFNVLMPRIARFRLAGNVVSLRAILASGFLLVWVVAFLGFIIVLFFGQIVLEGIGANTNIIAFPLLGLMLITAFLEINHGASAMVISSSNDVPFVPAALLSGVAILGASFFFASHGFPLWTIVATQMIVQLLYNNWRWPLQVFLEFRFHFRDFAAAFGRIIKGGL